MRLIGQGRYPRRNREAALLISQQSREPIFVRLFAV